MNLQGETDREVIKKYQRFKIPVKSFIEASSKLAAEKVVE